jgi:hypothetical protein
MAEPLEVVELPLHPTRSRRPPKVATCQLNAPRPPCERRARDARTPSGTASPEACAPQVACADTTC